MELHIKIEVIKTNETMKKLPQFIPEEAESYWDAIEIHPVKEIEKGIYETVEEEEGIFWSVYLHQLNGGLKCIADVKTKIEAMNFAELIENSANYKVYSKSL
jgi:hypothetical protein